MREGYSNKTKILREGYSNKTKILREGYSNKTKILGEGYSNKTKILKRRIFKINQANKAISDYIYSDYFGLKTSGRRPVLRWRRSHSSEERLDVLVMVTMGSTGT